MIDKLIAARILMGADAEGQNKCASCGRLNAAHMSRKRIKPNFVEFGQLLVSGGNYLCDSCLALIDDPDMRFKPLLYLEHGAKIVLEREAVLPLLSKPPATFVLTVPYAFKKHHWLYAGLSTDKMAYVGTDSRTIIINYQQHDIPAIISTIKRMIETGVPRAEIIAGEYKTITRARVPCVDKMEQVIAPVRASGAIELFVKYTPAVKAKIKIETEGDIVLTRTERTAINLLKSVAVASLYRKEDGLRFWDGYYKRRINRFRGLELKEFLSRLCASVDADIKVDLSEVELMSDGECAVVMADIKTKTDLLLSLAYTDMKNEKSQRQSKRARNESVDEGGECLDELLFGANEKH